MYRLIPVGLSTTSYVLVVSICAFSPASPTSCMHLVAISKFPPPCARSIIKTCTGQRKNEGAKVQRNIRPNVSAYNNGVLPPLLWKQGPQSRCTGPKNRNRCQKQIPSLSRTIPSGPTQIHPGPQKLLPQGPGNTNASLPHFL